MEISGNLYDHVEKLRVLNFVGRSGSITKAAALLHITHAAASHSIRVLETVLGVQLLHRQPRGIQLTESGKILFEFSQRLLADVRSVEMRALHPEQSLAGALRVGTHETLAVHVWPPFLQRFSKESPHVVVSLISGRIESLVAGLLNREYHVIVTVEPSEHREIDREPLYSGPMGLFVGTGAGVRRHPLLRQRVLDLSEANELPILTDAMAHLRQSLPLPVFLLDQGFRLERFYELNSFEAAMRLAMVGVGIAVVPERNAADYVRKGQLRPLRIREIKPATFGVHRVCASVRKDQRRIPLVRHFFDEVVKLRGTHKINL